MFLRSPHGKQARSIVVQNVNQQTILINYFFKRKAITFVGCLVGAVWVRFSLDTLRKCRHFCYCANGHIICTTRGYKLACNCNEIL
jgi:hypothetical protein